MDLRGLQTSGLGRAWPRAGLARGSGPQGGAARPIGLRCGGWRPARALRWLGVRSGRACRGRSTPRPAARRLSRRALTPSTRRRRPGGCCRWPDSHRGRPLPHHIGDCARLSRRGAVTSLGRSGPSRERAGVRRVHIADGAPCAQAQEGAGPEVSPVRLRPIFGCQTSAVADPSLAKVTSRTRTAAASRTTVSVSAAVGTQTNRHRRADAWKTSIFT